MGQIEMPISFYIDMGQEDGNPCLALTVASKDSNGKLTFETHLNPQGDRYLSRKIGEGPEMTRGCTSDVDVVRIRVFDSLMSESQIVIPGHIVHFGTLSPDSPGGAGIKKYMLEARSVSSLDGSLTAPSGIFKVHDLATPAHVTYWLEETDEMGT